MQREPPRRAGAGAMASPPSFESKLEREEEVLEALATALARGQLPPEVWTKLHEAAVRDERVSELAFAYESFAQGRRLKMFPPPIVAELLFKASAFFADVLGDEPRSAELAQERVLAVVSPAHQAAFEQLDRASSRSRATSVARRRCTWRLPQHRPRARAGRAPAEGGGARREG